MKAPGGLHEHMRLTINLWMEARSLFDVSTHTGLYRILVPKLHANEGFANASRHIAAPINVCSSGMLK